MIILTATELSFVFEQTQISGNLEQFSFLHLSLQTYSNNWEEVIWGVGGAREGRGCRKYLGWPCLQPQASADGYSWWHRLTFRRQAFTSMNGRPFRTERLIVTYGVARTPVGQFHLLKSPSLFWTSLIYVPVWRINEHRFSPQMITL